MEKRSRRRIRDLVARPASLGLSENEIGCARISMVARNTNVPFKGRIQKRKTYHLQILTFRLQRAAGPYRNARGRQLDSYCAVQPPSIGIAAPVMLWAVGCASHSTNAPISSGREVRRLGCFSASRLEIASSRLPPISAARAAICGSIIAVSVQPGQMQLTVIPPPSQEPRAAYSSAATRDSPTKPNF